MRWKELLTESPKTYLPMFQAILDLDMGEETNEQNERTIPLDIKLAEEKLKRKDRVVWYLRWLRLRYVTGMIDSAMGSHLDVEEAGRELIEKLKVLRTKYMRECGMADENDYDANAGWAYNLSNLAHFVGTPSQKLQAIQWNRQKPEDLMNELRAAEEEWQESRKQELEPGDEKVFLDLGDGWAWYNLETPTCDREAKAMGHCGNAGGTYDQTILSLRRKLDNGNVRPSLTFILKDDGWLGEMKGRANEKPNAKYHEAIKALLLDPRIVGIDGGGYAPENNFALDDLEDEAWVEQLKQKKPGMRGAAYLYDEWVKAGQPENTTMARIADKIRDSLKERGYSYHKLLMGEGVIRVDSWKSRDAYLDVYHSYTKMLHDFFFEELADEIERETLMPERKARNIATAAANALYDKMFDELLTYDCEYEVNQGSESADMYPRWKDGKIVLDLSIEDYLYLFLEDEDANDRSWGRGRIEHLDDVVEGHHDLSDVGIFQDDSIPPLEHGILRYIDAVEKSYEPVRRSYGNVKRKIPRIPSHLVQEIIAEFSGEASKLSDSPTEHDPNQLEFDFQSPDHGKVNF